MDEAMSKPEFILSSNPDDWVEVQNLLKRKVILEDNFMWSISASESSLKGTSESHRLRFIGGVDISFCKDDPSIACGAIVIVDIASMEVVYDDYNLTQLQIPYVPGFLAFREGPVLLELLEKMKLHTKLYYPQLLMVDGNGLLHPRGFGLASHLGVMADLPTIGVGKNAMRSSEDSIKPIFISIGHRISLETATKVVKMCCKYRIPEPIRQADIRSRAYLLRNARSLKIAYEASSSRPACNRE
ncbi:endonuclease V isoform X3 [Amborella trichopoda]|uniref:endonuclease V isoform X3 n=1 Tax=Amborella trichopoda TaxID=13333 RepID=UPI0009BD6516|nr:endonuclease V isoform X3 [Amborella trichopoda]|eukprot:XP_020526866.1 endonuclease V isoform X3 [Amborella trichopoda]